MHPYLKKHIESNPKIILVAAAAITGLLAALLAISLKHITEHYEGLLFGKAAHNNLWVMLFPMLGLSLIYLLRYYIFRKKENKGIKEVFESTGGSKPLPAYKIPSHFVNGLLTVSFGGSTGIEVSTVVATAAVGSLASQKEGVLKKYKTDLICAGIAAGITALFNAPLAGIFFAYEVVSKKYTHTFAISTLSAAITAFGLTTLLDEAPLLNVTLSKWHLHALPWFILLGAIAGVQSVYLTKSVLYFKNRFSKISNGFYKIFTGGVIISGLIVLLPQLYGDGYHALKHSIATAASTNFSQYFLLTITGILIFKPIITSVTLSAGGDGGVFAPGMVIGAFLGLLTAVVLNTFFDAGVIPLNFMIVGMAAVLSAAIHAPLTALFLICALTNSYILIVPLFIASYVAMYMAKMIYPYTVYSYAGQKN